MALLGKIICSVLIGAYYPFVSWMLWGWFAVPLGAPVIPYWYAFGLYGFATTVLLWGLIAPKQREPEVAVVALKVILATLTLGEGWLVHALILT